MTANYQTLHLHRGTKQRFIYFINTAAVAAFCGEDYYKQYLKTKDDLQLLSALTCFCKSNQHNRCKEILDPLKDKEYYKAMYLHACEDFDMYIEYINDKNIFFQCIELTMIAVDVLILRESFALAYKIIKLINYKDINLAEYRNSYQEIKNKLLDNRTISIVIPYMNKDVTNLFTCVSSWLNIEFIKEIIIVDYSSHEPIAPHLQDLQNKGDIKVLRVEKEKYFNLSRAINLGLDQVTGDYICKIDCDFILQDSSFIETLIMSNELDFFVRGSSSFSKSLSGFLFCHKSKIINYREDINGWGYEDVDLYNRIKIKNPDIKEIIWFDIRNYIRHIPHSSLTRSLNYRQKNIRDNNNINKMLCQYGQYNDPPRLTYVHNENAIIFNKPKISQIYYINNSVRNHRWQNIKHILDLRRILYQHNPLDTINQTREIHKKVWQDIVNNNYKYSLILEDDVDAQSVLEFITGEFVPDKNELIDCIQKRKTDRINIGTKAYILSLSGAIKLSNLNQKGSVSSLLNNDCLTKLEYPVINRYYEPEIFFEERCEYDNPE